MSRLTAAVLTVAAALFGPTACETLVYAAATPEQRCQKDRHFAAAKYAQCEGQALGNFHAAPRTDKLEKALSKCRVKYAGTWIKLQKKALGTGSPCDRNRFVDNGNGTVTDNLTGLQWEKKRNDIDEPQDRLRQFSWFDASAIFLAGNGGTQGLNEAPGSDQCFAAVCDWRLPTRAELQTILSEPFPCTTDPCIAALFGPTASGFYWTTTSYASDPTLAWSVSFIDGFVQVGAPIGDKNTPNFVRAVRTAF